VARRYGAPSTGRQCARPSLRRQSGIPHPACCLASLPPVGGPSFALVRRVQLTVRGSRGAVVFAAVLDWSRSCSSGTEHPSTIGATRTRAVARYEHQCAALDRRSRHPDRCGSRRRGGCRGRRRNLRPV
jgi:hypothetical protein